VYPEHLIRATTRLSRRSSGDLRVIRRATTRIEEVSASLDRQLLAELRPDEQVRLLRQATSQITRAANDAIQAYRRVTEGLNQETQRGDTDPSEAERMARTLADARSEMLEALDVASRRYPWAKPWRPSDQPEGSP
jgi:hypothetical protein